MNTSSKPGSSNKQLRSIWLGLGLVFLSITFMLVLQPEDEEPLLETQTRLPVVSVVSANSGEHTVEIVTAGAVKARRVSHVNSRVAGYVDFVSDKLALGNRVKKGDPLLTLDSMAYRIALADAEKELASAKIKVLEERARAKQAQNDINKMKNTAEVSELTQRIPQLEESEASFAAKKIALEKAKADLAHSKMLAPFDGVILNTHVNEAEWIEKDKPIFSIADASVYEIILPLREDQWALLDQSRALIGSTVKVTLNSCFKRVQDGVIKRISPEIDVKTGSLAVIVEFENKDQANNGLIPLGAYARVYFPGKTFNKALWLPQSSLLPSNEVWAVSTDNVVAKLPVTILQHRDNQVLVQYNQKQPQPISIVQKTNSNFIEGDSLKPRLEKFDHKESVFSVSGESNNHCNFVGWNFNGD